MKPNADMITKVLHNFRVNGKFDQDQLIIGRGVDEQLQLMISDTVGIRYTPKVTGERTFTILGTTDHPVFDETVTLYPYSKPVNDFTNSWVLADEDVIWISDKFTDPDFPNTRYIMYIGGAGGPNPNQWRVHTIGSSDTGIYGVDWNNASNTPDFLGAQENVTWSNGEASAYPSSPSDWSTSGYQGVQPTSFSMTNTEGSDPKLEYTNNGTTWYEFGRQGSVSLTYEPIEFNASHLSNDGKITIQHNFNDKNVLCLGCTPQPKEIEYLDNQIVLDYSDQNSSNFTGAVWFINSQQSMLTGGPDPSQFSMVFCDTPIGSTSTYSELQLKPGTIFRLVKDTPGTDLNSRKWVGETNRSTGSTYTIVHRDSDDRWVFNVKGSDGTTQNDFVVATTSGHANPWDVPKWEFQPDSELGVFYGQLFQPIDLTKLVFRITDAGEPLLIGDYVEVPTTAWSQYASTKFTPDRTITHIYTNVEYGDYVVEGNSVEPYIYHTTNSPGNPCTQPFYKGKVFTDSNDPLSVTAWEVVNCVNPLPTLAVI